MVSMKDVHKGTIVKMHRDRDTQDSYIEIDDEVRGKVLVKCLGTPLVKAFHKAFGGGVVVDGKFNKGGIAGKKIGYRVDEKGFLSEFTHETSPQTTWFPGGGSHTDHGYLPPDHPLYGAGPIVAGREILEPHLPSTVEEKAKNLQILREAAKGWRWVPVVPGTIPGMGEGKWFMPDGKEYTSGKRGESEGKGGSQP